jgi:hypothetical protein
VLGLVLACAGLAAAGGGCGDNLAVQADAGVQDDAPPPPSCAPDQPEGACPSGRVCRGGACIVDLDTGAPPGGDPLGTADWIWAFFDLNYGAFPATHVDWEAVHQRLLADVSAAPTQFAYHWAVVSAVGELQDGHSYAEPTGWCDQTGLFGLERSNTGACVVEVADGFIVYKAVPDNPMGLVAGDEVLAVDGRTVEAALSDLEAQPRCYVSFSTAAGLRDSLVASVMYRPATDTSMRVRRVDGTVVDLDIQPLPEGGLLKCDGRIGVPDPVDQGYGIESALLPGNVLYAYLPLFGIVNEEGALGGYQTVLRILTQLFTEAEQTAGLVLDLRSNPGGIANLYFAIASWLFPEPTDLFTCRPRVGRGHDDFGAPHTFKSEPDPTLQMTRPLAVLTNSGSASCADFTPLLVQTTGRGKTFGAASSGAFGQVVPDASLPDWEIAYNNILCSDTAGNLLQGHPPATDFPVAYTEADIRQGVDTVVEAARAWVAAQ